MNVVWTRPAADDLEHALAYIAQFNPAAAATVAARIQATVASIAQFPHAGRRDDEAGTRERIVSGTPFLLVYTIDDVNDFAEIIALFHMARDPGSKRRP